MATSDINTPQKQCTKCQHSFPRTSEYFHRCKAASDGLKGKCKDCNKADARAYHAANAVRMNAVNAEWRRAHPEKMREYQTAYVERHPARVQQSKHAHASAHRKEHVQRTAQQRIDHPEKYEARKAVQIAVQQGRLMPITQQACMRCGRQAHHYHHPSYEPERRLDVIPLCTKCHKAIHKGG